MALSGINHVVVRRQLCACVTGHDYHKHPYLKAAGLSENVSMLVGVIRHKRNALLEEAVYTPRKATREGTSLYIK